MTLEVIKHMVHRAVAITISEIVAASTISVPRPYDEGFGHEDVNIKGGL